ncbi:MAG: PAS domain-containing sensor histidine kinase, partial [Alphaproteobacteria bacterium]
MKGSERRYQGARRRASDTSAAGLPAWARVALLILALALAVYVLLFARVNARPAQELAALREQALQQDARLLAATLETRIASARAGTALVAERLRAQPTRLLEATEAGRAASPGVAFALMSAGGEVTAAAGAPAARFEPREPL